MQYIFIILIILEKACSISDSKLIIIYNICRLYAGVNRSRNCCRHCHQIGIARLVRCSSRGRRLFCFGSSFVLIVELSFFEGFEYHIMDIFEFRFNPF